MSIKGDGPPPGQSRWAYGETWRAYHETQYLRDLAAKQGDTEMEGTAAEVMRDIVTINRLLLQFQSEEDDHRKEHEKFLTTVQRLRFLVDGMQGLLGGPGFEIFEQLCLDGVPPVEAVEVAHNLTKENLWAEWAKEGKS